MSNANDMRNKRHFITKLRLQIWVHIPSGPDPTRASFYIFWPNTTRPAGLVLDRAILV